MPAASRAPATTIVTSPRAPLAKRSASSASVPRANSSCTLVSSRATQAARSPSCAASARSVAATRRGDSKSTSVSGRTRNVREQAVALARLARQEAEEREGRRREARRDERRDHRRRAGQRHDARVPRRSPPRRAARPDPRPAAYPRPRPARPAARREQREHFGDARGFVVRVERARPLRDRVAVEQHARVARVLGEHEVRFAQHPQRAQRHVLEIADRRRDEMERAHGARTLARRRPAVAMRDHALARRRPAVVRDHALACRLAPAVPRRRRHGGQAGPRPTRVVARSGSPARSARPRTSRRAAIGSWRATCAPGAWRSTSSRGAAACSCSWR